MQAAKAATGVKLVLCIGGAGTSRNLPAFFFVFFALVTGPRTSVSLKLSDTGVYGP